MKVEVKNKVNEIKYPCLMIVKNNNLIVLFYSNKCGTCIDNGNTDHEIGHYSEKWAMELFSYLDGEVTLKND